LGAELRTQSLRPHRARSTLGHGKQISLWAEPLARTRIGRAVKRVVETRVENLTFKSVERLALKLRVEPLDLLKPPSKRQSARS
jgi:hypothetical protein